MWKLSRIYHFWRQVGENSNDDANKNNDDNDSGDDGNGDGDDGEREGDWKKVMALFPILFIHMYTPQGRVGKGIGRGKEGCTCLCKC